MTSSINEVIIYKSEDGKSNLSVKIEDETVWLSQAQLVDLYKTSKSNISEHIKHIFEDGELDKHSVVRNFRITASDGKNYLDKDELFRLNRMVSAFFDLAELKAQEQTKMHMQDWVKELDTFTTMYGKGTLEGAGKISRDKAMQKAEEEYKKYQVNTISPVEKNYLDTIKTLNKRVSKKDKGNQ